ERLAGVLRRVEASARRAGRDPSEVTLIAVSKTHPASLVERAASCARVRLVGLMAMPPFDEDAERARPFFRRLRELRDEWGARGAFRGGAGDLSMGMSHDFEIAVEEGATMVRVGTAIFGAREKPRG
ncbi:MAG: alanine racemase, partial [Acidobacteria bacterium]|nr:alanine racemase [Acidobacteriota bacterium]